MSAVTLPGDLPGLLRRGAPIIGGVLVACVDDCAVVTWEDDGECLMEADIPLTRLSLDLADPAGMDIAARWLAERHGFALLTAPWWTYEYPSPTPRDGDGAPYREDWPGRWVLVTSTGDSLTFVDVDPEIEEGEEGWYPEDWIVVRGIVTTNPAEALALACLVIAGRTA